MSDAGRAFAAAAEGLVGTPFRLHGRDPDFGIDCVGLVSVALAKLGRTPCAPAGYRLRQAGVDALLSSAADAGFEPTTESIASGDLILVRAGPAQHHVLVAGRDGGFVHAHAGLRRVVRSPAPLPWPVLRRWRLTG